MGEATRARRETLVVANQLSSLEGIFLAHLLERLSKAEVARKRAQSTRAAGETDQTEGERDAPSIDADINTMAQAFARNRGPIALALRYRSQIERSAEKALHELQRLQAARRGQVLNPPEVIDVNVHLTGREEDEIRDQKSPNDANS